MIEQGAVGGFPATGFAFGCALNPRHWCRALINSPCCRVAASTWRCCRSWRCQAPAMSMSHLAARPHVTAGVGGFNDIITRAPKIVYSGYFTAGKKDIQIGDGQLKIISDGAIAKFVPDIAQISFSGEMARKRRQEVLYVTNAA